MYRIKYAAKIIVGVATILYARKKEKKWAVNYIKQLERQFNGKLSQSATSRAVVSYSGFIPMISDAFTQLRGRKSNPREKERMLLYFICSSIFDDFCDRKELTADELYRISYHPETYEATRFEERLFLHAHLALKEYVRDKHYYNSVTKELFKVQLESANQFNSLISDDQIKHITLTKGRASTLLCHFYLDEVASPIEQSCWGQLGVMLQITDDLLDIHEDLQDGLQTLPIRMKDTKQFYAFFMDLVQQMKDMILDLPFPNKQKEHLVISLVGICSLSSLALQQLAAIQGAEAQLPNLKNMPRKALIIDMEKPRNLLYCMKFTYQQTVAWLESADQNTSPRFAKMPCEPCAPQP